MATYAEKLRDPRWQKKRLEIMERDGFQCRECGDKEAELHVHHGYYGKGRQPWEYPDEALITLCADCHDDYEHWREKLLANFMWLNLDQQVQVARAAWKWQDYEHMFAEAEASDFPPPTFSEVAKGLLADLSSDGNVRDIPLHPARWSKKCRRIFDGILQTPVAHTRVGDLSWALSAITGISRSQANGCICYLRSVGAIHTDPDGCIAPVPSVVVQFEKFIEAGGVL
jgi:hypothetical protein